MGYPVFVTEIRKETNEVILGTEEYLLKNGMIVGKLNLQKYENIPKKIKDLYFDENNAIVLYNDEIIYFSPDFLQISGIFK
jgi:tRNA U34 2-thiouridine synthase MnmA/TrmU